MHSTHRADWLLAAGVGLSAALISFVWSWRPSYWYDEAATLTAIDRSPLQLWHLVGNVDAVHAVYYFAMQAWVGVFGTAEAATRGFSAVGIAFAGAAMYALGRRLFGWPLGLAAGLIAAVLPGLSWTGAEAREYSWSAAFAVLATLALVRAAQVGRVSDWVWYAIAMTTATYVFLFNVLLLAAHLTTMLALRLPLKRWCGSAVVAILAASPILVTGWTQRGQITWIEMGTVEMLGRAGLRQAFLSTLADAQLGIALASAVLLFLVAIGLGVAALASSDPAKAWVLAVALPWVIVPTAIVIVYSLIRTPIYQERYLVFSVPGVALVVGFGLLGLRQRQWAFVTACVLLAALATPILVQQKDVTAKNGAHFRRLATFIDQQEVDGAIYTRNDGRSLLVAYPDRFQGITELNVSQTHRESDTLWGLVAKNPPVDHGPLAGTVIAVVARTDRRPPQPWVLWLEDRGCRMQAKASDPRLTILTFAC